MDQASRSRPPPTVRPAPRDVPRQERTVPTGRGRGPQASGQGGRLLHPPPTSALLTLVPTGPPPRSLPRSPTSRSLPRLHFGAVPAAGDPGRRPGRGGPLAPHPRLRERSPKGPFSSHFSLLPWFAGSWARWAGFTFPLWGENPRKLPRLRKAYETPGFATALDAESLGSLKDLVRLQLRRTEMVKPRPGGQSFLSGSLRRAFVSWKLPLTRGGGVSEGRSGTSARPSDAPATSGQRWAVAPSGAARPCDLSQTRGP